ncbi:Ti-type conjugative transfer relaxase TraA (plasmid) [Rhizobium rosettiformans]|uniref:Ti-type conjugative transfer relaxase TraA n=2 Tax=Rhizobium TaxID=379 RepID=A0ABX7F226_9HYPH|nr:Ti-type conjugative transfer relaxase TraA [Rhizobium rosettiformans]QRF54567.1 Ti-type conjugative transfer relaxase TraA [Rhizobium rosettiformans]
MAVPHFSVSIVGRSSGRSAVMSAAYRHCARMDFEREARRIDYTRKRGLRHEEFVIPADAPDWLCKMIGDRSVAGASEAFWNHVEIFEKRGDAQLAKDVTIALPVELSTAENIQLMREFVEALITSKGMVADWVYHDVPGNPHVHLMTTLRPLTEGGFGAKKLPVLLPDGGPLRNDAGKIVYEVWAGGTEDFNALRDGWFSCLNRHLMLAGLDLYVDGRSFKKQGIELQPTLHIGVGATAVDRKSKEVQARETVALPTGLPVPTSAHAPLSAPFKAPGVPAHRRELERIALQEEVRAHNLRRIEENPRIVLDLVTREKSVFDERDIAKILHRYVDDAARFQGLMTRIIQHPDILRLDQERIDFTSGMRRPARVTTRQMIRLEARMASRANWLSEKSAFDVGRARLEKALSHFPRLSDEQKAAISHVTAASRIALVIGRAGAGKTTMMKAAREVWEAAGYQVVGAALAGKAAEGLEKEAGIASRTLSSWELRWDRGRNLLDEKTIMVLDEAGMVSSKQMALLLEQATLRGAKLVLIGDPEQLQPIEAGAAFRAIADRIGYAELETIYRQYEPWMREASLDLAHGHVENAVSSYVKHGRVMGSETKAEAVRRLIADWERDYDPGCSGLILAHLRRDVRLLNQLARQRLVERGFVEPGHSFKTEEGIRLFAAGDQIVFLKNDASLGVKNGLLAKVVTAGPGFVTAEIGAGEDRRLVRIDERLYRNLDHGYATTIHKSQGATVERVKVLASLSLDRHLTYVAMTRHRQELHVYYGIRSFSKAGGLGRVLSRKNTKETTLDYEENNFYRVALRFAEARGLHIINVAHMLVRARLEWTCRQKERLTELGSRLIAIAGRLRQKQLVIAPVQTPSDPIGPMVSGMTTFAKSIGQAVEEKLAVDPVLKRQWQEVLARFNKVYRDPETAFRALQVDAMMKDTEAARLTLDRVAKAPESFGELKGRPGFLANARQKRDRELALANASALARNLNRYLRARAEAEIGFMLDEHAIRQRASLEIPGLSPAAMETLSRLEVRLDRQQSSGGLDAPEIDGKVRSELERFAEAVATRFGERTLLVLAAKNPDGEVFQKLTADMSPAQKREVQAAWMAMRTSQQLSAAERLTKGQRQVEGLRKTQSKGLSLK